jgi:hypothetical protein
MGAHPCTNLSASKQNAFLGLRQGSFPHSTNVRSDKGEIVRFLHSEVLEFRRRSKGVNFGRRRPGVLPLALTCSGVKTFGVSENGPSSSIPPIPPTHLNLQEISLFSKKLGSVGGVGGATEWETDVGGVPGPAACGCKNGYVAYR